jgi:hypothetical protein
MPSGVCLEANSFTWFKTSRWAWAARSEAMLGVFVKLLSFIGDLGAEFVAKAGVKGTASIQAFLRSLGPAGDAIACRTTVTCMANIFLIDYSGSRFERFAGRRRRKWRRLQKMEVVASVAIFVAKPGRGCLELRRQRCVATRSPVVHPRRAVWDSSGCRSKHEDRPSRRRPRIAR